MAQQQTMIQLSLGELYTVIGIIGAVMAVITVYFSLFVSNKLSNMKDEILKGIKMEFVTKEVVTLQIAEVRNRISRLETSGPSDSGVRKRRVDDDE